MQEKPYKQKTWQKLARKLRRQINFAWWLEKLIPILTFATLIAFAAIIIYRNKFELNPGYMLASILAILTICGLAAYLTSRKNLIDTETALERLDLAHNLKQTLPLAQKNLTTWPTLSNNPTHLKKIRWRFRKILLPIFFNIALISFGLAVPIVKQNITEQADNADNLPSTLKKVIEDLETLENTEIVEEDDIEIYQEKAKELTSQKMQDLFSHENLEAADNLLASLQNDTEHLAKNAEKISFALSALNSEKLPESNFPALPEEFQKLLAKEFQKSLSDLNSGNLKLNSKLAEQLNKISANDLKKMLANAKKINATQLKKMLENLSKCQSACRISLNDSKNLTQSNAEKLRKLMAEFEKNGLMNSAKSPKACKFPRPGKGGITRGRGDADMSLKLDESQLDSQNTIGVSNQDYSRALPGEVLQVVNSKWDIDKKKVSSSEGGGGSVDRGRRRGYLAEEF